MNFDCIIFDGLNMMVMSEHSKKYQLMQNSSGQPTGVIYGVLKTLLNSLKRWRCKNIYFVYDSGVDTYKKQLDESYKQGRTSNYSQIMASTPEATEQKIEFLRQKDVLIKILNETLAIRTLTIPEVEADNVIGCLSSFYNKSLIYSGDSDFISLHNETTCWVFNSRKKEFRSTKDFGVIGPCYAVCKSIVGDPTDSIKGLKGVGWKTVIKWLNTECPFDIDDLKNLCLSRNDKLGNKILENFNEVEKNFKLIKLDCTAGQYFHLQLLEKVKDLVSNPPKYDYVKFLDYVKKEGFEMMEFYDLVNYVKLSS